MLNMLNMLPHVLARAHQGLDNVDVCMCASVSEGYVVSYASSTDYSSAVELTRMEVSPYILHLPVDSHVTDARASITTLPACRMLSCFAPSMRGSSPCLVVSVQRPAEREFEPSVKHATRSQINPTVSPS